MPREKKANRNGANLGYEAELWQMADALRGRMDTAEYKHIVLGLIFLKYISDAFDEHNVRFKADHILVNLAFFVSDWREELLREDERWLKGEVCAPSSRQTRSRHATKLACYEFSAVKSRS